MSLEHDLRRALRRKQPSDGFAERVLARQAPSTRADGGARSWQGTTRWLAAAAAVLVIAGGTLQHFRNQQMRRETAKAEVMAALAIASEKLQLVRELVRDHR
jgi:hypothetical protein